MKIVISIVLAALFLVGCGDTSSETQNVDQAQVVTEKDAVVTTKTDTATQESNTSAPESNASVTEETK